MFPHTKTHTLLMKSKNRTYTHSYTTQRPSFNRCLFRDIRTNKGLQGVAKYLGKKIVSQVTESLGILLKKGLILPILIRRRNYPDDTWVFMLVVVCQMGVFVRTPTPFGVKTSGIFLILNRRRIQCK